MLGVPEPFIAEQRALQLEEIARRIAASAEEVVCLRAPEDFGAVGRFYRTFDQTEDREVVEILGKWQETRRGQR